MAYQHILTLMVDLSARDGAALFAKANPRFRHLGKDATDPDVEAAYGRVCLSSRAPSPASRRRATRACLEPSAADLAAIICARLRPSQTP